MKTTTKIRWLLLIVTIGLFATSLTARWAATNFVNLYDKAQDIGDEVNDKEEIIYSYLAKKENLESLKNLDRKALLAEKTINDFTSKHIYFQTYKNGELNFWSDAKITANNVNSFKEGSSFLGCGNGWYEVIKRSDDDFFVLFFIPIKSNLPYKNQYLNDDNTDDFIINNKNIDIAALFDKNVADIKGIDGRYLFSIKKSNSFTEIPHGNIEIALWAFGLLTLILLINSIAKYYADEGKISLSIAILTISFALIRYLGLKYHFPEALYSLKLFDPKIYASNFYFPSFADLALNTVFVLWITIFIYGYRRKIFKAVNNQWLGYFLMIVGLAIIMATSYLYVKVFFGLVFNSSINFRVSNLVNLNWLSFIGIFLLMLAMLSYYLIIDILVTFSTFISINLRRKTILLALAFFTYCGLAIYFGHYTIFSVLVFALIFIIGRIIYVFNGKAIFPFLILISFIFACIVSLKLNGFESYKELEVRKRLLFKLESADDPYAIISFTDIENEIVNDPYLLNVFQDSVKNTTELNGRINNLYLANYLSKFEYRAYLFDYRDSLISTGKSVDINTYRNQVVDGSIKVTNYFYRLNHTFGVQNYFAIIPIKSGNVTLGTLVLELKSKQLGKYGIFPQLLQNGKVNPQSEFSNYSYAFYENKKLVNKSGVFIYDLVNTEFNGVVNKFVELKKGSFDHIIYKPNKNKTIVVTSEANTFWRELASLSFFFIIFLLFSLIVVSYKWIISSFITYNISFKNLRIRFLSSNNKILYKTRIQIALVLAVVSSLLIIGIITFSYISIQYKEQQQDIIRSKIRIIAEAFQENISREVQSVNGANKNLSFEEFSKMYNTDLNLFDKKGKLLFSTQYKIYAIGLIANRMDANAFLNLDIRKKSEFIQEESINKLSYTSAYMPVKNIDNNVVAYLQLPYFANQEDFNQKIGTFLNLLINIYVLVFVAIGFFAFVVANQITSPLSLIQDSISKTMMGKKNNPIMWKRNDEIGSLIKEYNAMVATIEENANKLAQSERETAWREMAKQVAHEIKNPLTPLKLGIQMLDRSWKDRDERFDEKFKKFSKSFLEQIDSLSHIASEFSNFAKMPELKLEHADLLEILNRATQVYSQMDHIQIICKEKTVKNCIINVDKDQLLRSFNNLLKNAIEAMPDGHNGVIKIEGKKVNNKIEISISDNGNGIPINSRDSIFRPNFTTKSSGTGLGLAFVKQAIENVQGNIYFTTEINVGTTFYIILPLVNK